MLCSFYLVLSSCCLCPFHQSNKSPHATNQQQSTNTTCATALLRVDLRLVSTAYHNTTTRNHARGLKNCVWINPYIAQLSPLFDEGMKKGYFLKRENGDVWQWDLWQAGMAIIDLTNPAACQWFAQKLQALLDLGVDYFKTDFGERIPTDVVYHDGS